MTSNSGIIAVDKFVFGEAATPNNAYHIKDLEYTAADKHLRDLCANCHLGAQKTEYGPITELSRGGGCNACHLNYSEDDLKGLNAYLDSDKKTLPNTHPATDIFVSNMHCYGCHSRSARISTNYEGWQETLLDEVTVDNDNDFKVAMDKRVYEFKGADIHHQKGLLCIDCHSSHEVMGDGLNYTHAEEVVKVQCSDCHFKEKPNTMPYDSLDTESLKVFLHRGYTHIDKPVIQLQKSGHPLVNTYVDEAGKAYLLGKKDGELHAINPQGEQCSSDNVHNALSCSTCHSSWTSKCIGCHNSFDPNESEAFDLLDREYTTGQWKEFVAEFSSTAPAMGVREKEGKRLVEPAIPGMILTIDKGSYTGESDKNVSFHRLYAANSPHTTTGESRDCKSCHSDPFALGFGAGLLAYNITDNNGKWEFTPEYELNAHDGLPEDAWIPFLRPLNKDQVVSTRSNFRPFTVKEQKRLLLVGSCLECHDNESPQMQESLVTGLDALLKTRSENCVLPNY